MVKDPFNTLMWHPSIILQVPQPLLWSWSVGPRIGLDLERMNEKWWFYIYICLLQQLTANISPDLNILLEQSSCPSTLSLSCHLHRSLWDCILGCHSLLPIMVITILPLTAKCCHLASAVPDSCRPFTQGKPFNSVSQQHSPLTSAFTLVLVKEMSLAHR